eukprot:1249499-Ditylum_brightwellii.AAC.1
MRENESPFPCHSSSPSPHHFSPSLCSRSSPSQWRSPIPPPCHSIPSPCHFSPSTHQCPSPSPCAKKRANRKSHTRQMKKVPMVLHVTDGEKQARAHLKEAHQTILAMSQT